MTTCKWVAFICSCKCGLSQAAQKCLIIHICIC